MGGQVARRVAARCVALVVPPLGRGPVSVLPPGARSDHCPSGNDTPSLATWTAADAGFSAVALRMGSADAFHRPIRPGSARYMLALAELEVVTAPVNGQSLSSTHAAAFR